MTGAVLFNLSLSNRLRSSLIFALGAFLGLPPQLRAADSAARAQDLPIRGLHLSAPAKSGFDTLLAFVRDVLPKQGVNTLVLEFNYNYDFRSLPEFASPASLGTDELQQLVKACREHGIQLIPQINCLGHQSWAQRNDRLLAKHPEFDETAGKFPENKGIYCRSYCPLHPQLHAVLFSLIDELAAAAQAKAFHVGMDEVFILADPDCPRCAGKSTAEIFAGEVKTLHDHLAQIGCRTWMWGDRFLDAKKTGLGKWEASENETPPALALVPKDLVICDWHYDAAPPTAQFFAEKGFDVISCPWRKTPVALNQLEQIRAIRSGADRAAAPHALGIMQTTWCGASAFAGAYSSVQSGGTNSSKAASESAACFARLFSALSQAGQ